MQQSLWSLSIRTSTEQKLKDEALTLVFSFFCRTIVASLVNPIAASFNESQNASYLGTAFLLANIVRFLRSLPDHPSLLSLFPPYTCLALIFRRTNADTVPSKTFTPLYGRLCDIIGRRAANGLALSLFTLGTVLCAFAPTLKWLILARFVAGAGGGGINMTS